jgi:pimeloyl-ACP methyl ester carboxylesterase
MELNYRRTGEGPPLIIAHGLYGSSDNWLSVGKALARDFEVYMIDQRNHGQSPHSSEHSYAAMKKDLFVFMAHHSIERAILLGHSMGGKTVMRFAMDYPEMVSRLIVADIAPRAYHTDKHDFHHGHILKALAGLDTSQVSSLRDATRELSKSIPSRRVVQFLLKNLAKKDGQYHWTLNIKALQDNLDEIMQGMDLSNYNSPGTTGFPALFVRGGESGYIRDDDIPMIEKLFPYARTETIEGAGHWLHAEKQEEFIETIKEFIYD